MNQGFWEPFEDAYLKTPEGKGVFLCGVVLGQIASCQGKQLLNAPLTRQLNWGKVTMKELKTHLARVPMLLRAYKVYYSWKLNQLLGEAGELLFRGNGTSLGVEGNFILAVAFTNSYGFFFQLFPELEKSQQESESFVEEEGGDQID
ncbi:MAG TPA: TM1802 family CRISPR-associated protein [Thermotogota bacterium]|nr:TM1802 family CRISPR-associated protein [Thermotogota bacterium]HRW93505.1 TM1802 family CRISPR-associated protein [Thermotogota bacterium]